MFSELVKFLGAPLRWGFFMWCEFMSMTKNIYAASTIIVITMANAAKVSQTITNIPSLNAAPFNPTICSLDKLVNKSDPATTVAVRLRPAKKHPLGVAS